MKRLGKDGEGSVSLGSVMQAYVYRVKPIDYIFINSLYIIFFYNYNVLWNVLFIHKTTNTNLIFN